MHLLDQEILEAQCLLSIPVMKEQVTTQTQNSVVKKQNTWLNNKLMVKAMSFRYNVQIRLQGCCLEVIFLASPCLGGVFYKAGQKAVLACLFSTFLLGCLYHMFSSLTHPHSHTVCSCRIARPGWKLMYPASFVSRGQSKIL